MPRLTWHGVAASLALVALTACGDAPTNDSRGFTKAPLEKLSVFIDSETRSDVSAFARLNLPDGQRIVPPAPVDSAGG